MGEKVKVDRKEAEAKEPKKFTPSVGLSGKYVFKDGKYVYVTEEEEKSKEGEPSSSKYSFSQQKTSEEKVDNKEKEDTYSNSNTSTESSKENSQEAKQAEQEEETPKLNFGKYVFIGGRYVYVKEGEKVPEKAQPEESYIRKKAQVHVN